MKAIHLKALSRPDGTVTLPAGAQWTPGPVEIIILRPGPSSAGLMEERSFVYQEQFRRLVENQLVSPTPLLTAWDAREASRMAVEATHCAKVAIKRHHEQ